MRNIRFHDIAFAAYSTIDECPKGKAHCQPGPLPMGLLNEMFAEGDGSIHNISFDDVTVGGVKLGDIFKQLFNVTGNVRDIFVDGNRVGSDLGSSFTVV